MPVEQVYGLKQAPRAWYSRFATFLLTLGFVEAKSDTSLFIDHHADGVAYVLLYVDDIVLTASSPQLLQRIITSLQQEFAMKALGQLHHFLGVMILRWRLYFLTRWFGHLFLFFPFSQVFPAHHRLQCLVPSAAPRVAPVPSPAPHVAPMPPPAPHAAPTPLSAMRGPGAPPRYAEQVQVYQRRPVPAPTQAPPAPTPEVSRTTRLLPAVYERRSTAPPPPPPSPERRRLHRNRRHLQHRLHRAALVESAV
jgi:hypothetical protein